MIAVERAPPSSTPAAAAGADAVVDASGNDVGHRDLMDATGGTGADVVIDFVSSQTSLETGFACLGQGGRLVTLGGSGQDFKVSARALLNKEAVVMGSRYATRQEVLDTLVLAARGDFWPIVTEVYPLAEADKRARTARPRRGDRACGVADCLGKPRVFR